MTLRLAWNPKVDAEVTAAKQTFNTYRHKRYSALYAGEKITEFNPEHGVLTFEPIKTAFERLGLED